MLHSSGFSVGKIKTRLSEENVDVTRRSLYRLIKKFQQTNQYKDLHRRKREKKITPEMAIVMNNQLEENDKATATQHINGEISSSESVPFYSQAPA